MNVIRILFVMTVIIFSACKKDKNIDILGVVTNIKSGSALEGAEVRIYANVVGGNTYQNKKELVEKVLTDGNGNYSFSFGKMNTLYYLIEVDKPGFYMESKEINPDNLSVKEDNLYNFNIASSSSVSVRIRNAQPFDVNDKIVFSAKDATPDCPGCCQWEVIMLNGINADSTVSCAYFGDTNFEYSYVVTKNGNTQTYNGSQYCVAGQVNSIHVDY